MEQLELGLRIREMTARPDGLLRGTDHVRIAAGNAKSGTVHVSGAPVASGKAEGRMGGIRLITTLYAIFFVLIILIAIGSFFGVFDNPMIDPGL